MSDLELAKTQLYQKQLTLVIVKNGIILYQTANSRISGFLSAIEKLGSSLAGASVADRVVGKAVALLCVFINIKNVYASLLSQSAYFVFIQNNISCSYTEIVENILNKNKTDLCPFEKIALNLSQPNDAYQSFRLLNEKLNLGK
ncbi:MAG: DUF1893 domain-containing protein [Crenarchaeota archaeon]|nr:DUF1893 domain-containing protein [Thermoproteota archaeon]